MLGYAGYRYSLDYAKTRLQGRLAANRDPSSKPATAESAEARAEAGLLLDILTPVAKAWPSEWCLEANKLAIQAFDLLGGRALMNNGAALKLLLSRIAATAQAAGEFTALPAPLRKLLLS
eukprot:gene5321-7213_t